MTKIRVVYSASLDKFTVYKENKDGLFEEWKFKEDCVLETIIEESVECLNQNKHTN